MKKKQNWRQQKVQGESGTYKTAHKKLVYLNNNISIVLQSGKCSNLRMNERIFYITWFRYMVHFWRFQLFRTLSIPFRLIFNRVFSLSLIWLAFIHIIFNRCVNLWSQNLLVYMSRGLSIDSYEMNHYFSAVQSFVSVSFWALHMLNA